MGVPWSKIYQGDVNTVYLNAALSIKYYLDRPGGYPREKEVCNQGSVWPETSRPGMELQIRQMVANVNLNSINRSPVCTCTAKMASLYLM